MFTEATTNSAVYAQKEGSLWDSGLSGWDNNGNSSTSVWDKTTQTYSSVSTNTPIWEEQ